MKVKHNGKEIKLCEIDQTTCVYNNFKARIKLVVLADPEAICGEVEKRKNILIE